MFCMNCGNEIIDENSNCQFCGKLPLAENNFCYECGEKTPHNAIVCPNCEAPLSPDYEFPSDDEKTPMLYRSSDEGIVNGLCAGLAHKWGVSPAVVRIVTILFFFPMPLYILGTLLPAIPTKNNLMKSKL